MADTDIFMRDFNRYTGDGLPNEPVDAPLPIGDPESGAYVPTKAELRAWTGAIADEAVAQAFAAATGVADIVATLEDLPADVASLEGKFDARELHVADFGAVGDGVTDDTAAIQAAVNALLSGTRKILRFGAKHLITASINFTNTGGKRYEIIGGSSIGACNIIVSYHGYGTGKKAGAVFQSGNDASPAYQTSIGISGFLFTRSSGFRPPIGIQGASFAQSRINNITFGEWENITISLLTPQNVRMDTITTFGGGYTFPPRDASAVTVTQSGTTLSATAPIFSTTDDPGRTVSIWGAGSSSYRRKSKVVSYTGPQTVTVDESVTDATPRRIIFGSPGASMTSGSAALVADFPCFTAEHVGLVVWVKGAGVNGGLHRAKITVFQSSSTVTLDKTASTTVTKQEFAVPAMEIYSDPAFGNGASDVQITKLQIEGHKGIGLGIYDVDILHIQGKIHAEQTINNPQDISLATFWADRWAGSFQGDFDGQYCGEHRSFVTNLTKSLHIPSLHSRIAYNDTVMLVGPYFPGYEGALVVLGDIALSGGSSTETIGSGLFKDTAIGYGFSFTGTITQAEYDKNLRYLTRQITGTDDGLLTAKSIKLTNSDEINVIQENRTFSVVFADAATGGNIATVSSVSGKYSRIGSQVRARVKVLGLNTASLTSGNPIYVRGLPYASRGAPEDSFFGTVRLDGVTQSGAPFAEIGPGNSYIIIRMNVSNITTAPTLTAGACNNGQTTNMFLDIWYETSG